MHREAEQISGLQPGVGHVVAVTHPGHGFAGDAATVLDVREDVGQHLAGVEFIGQAIDDRDPGVRCKALYLGLLKSADHHNVGHAADDFGAVFNRLGPS